MRRNAFTLIELLVVISIIALLISILLPALGAALNSARSVQCLSNIRQWGIGSIMFSNDHNQSVPWDGEDNPGDLPGVGTQPTYTYDFWWANGVPPYVDYDPYRDTMAEAKSGGDPSDVPMADSSGSIFICPSAVAPSESAQDYPYDAPYDVYPPGSGLKFYFNYVPNSKLENGTTASWGVSGAERMTMIQVKEPTITILMLELRSTRAEFTSGAGEYKALNRAKAQWDRMAARHGSDASNMLFTDGHGDTVQYDYANQRQSDYVRPTIPGYNKPDLVWTPLRDAN